MSVYNRQKDVPAIVAELQSELESFKTVQIIGNANLIVRSYYDNAFGESITEDVTAIFKAEFVFNEPANSYVQIGFWWNSADSFSYDDVRYYDPDTIEDDTRVIAFMALTTSADITLSILEASASTTASGTFTLTRVV